MGAITPRRVLVVDDNRDAAEMTATLLRLLGQDVQATYDGASAIRLAESFAPDVAFVDLEMPGMDGFDVARRLRRKRGSPGLPLIVALTGHQDLAYKATIESAVFDAIVIKPASLEELSNVLSR